MKKEGLMKRIMKGLTRRDLRKNKLYSMLIMLIGYCTTFIEGDFTVFILTLFIGLPVFFAKKNVIV